MTISDEELPEIKLDEDNLYQEETFSDRRAGILRRMTPIKPDGSVDGERKTLFLGQTQLMTQMGALPISFEVEAESLAEALEKFPAAAKEGIKQTMEELQEMRREAASSLYVPGQGGGGMGGGGMGGPGGMPGGGGLGGGGGIQMP